MSTTVENRNFTQNPSPVSAIYPFEFQVIRFQPSGSAIPADLALQDFALLVTLLAIGDPLSDPDFMH
ncbi:MAG TPA: hypothetical protein VMU05_04925 [Dongiaceae bacterium]|nr:hypothetical protein [Dongiaceae bacterium]